MANRTEDERLQSTVGRVVITESPFGGVIVISKGHCQLNCCQLENKAKKM